MAGRQRCAKAAHDVVEPGLVGHEGVGVALDDDRPTRLADGRPSPVDQIEGAPLVEEQGLGRVEVLGAAIGALGPDDPPAEPGRSARGVPDGEDHPTPEAVVDAAAALAAAHQAGGLELVLADAATPGERVGQGVPGLRREAQLVGLDGLVGEPSSVEVGERLRAAGMVGEHAMVEGDGRLEHLAQSLSPGILAAGPLGQLDPGPGGESAESGREVHAVPFHDEVEDVPSPAAAEALPGLSSGSHDERGRLLAVEGTEPLPGGARLLEGHRLADDLDDVQLLLDGGSGAD
jgi:hypothetical protein